MRGRSRRIRRSGRSWRKRIRRKSRTKKKKMMMVVVAEEEKSLNNTS